MITLNLHVYGKGDLGEKKVARNTGPWIAWAPKKDCPRSLASIHYQQDSYSSA